MDTRHINILDHVPGLKKQSNRSNEYHAPCPKCGGEDRLVVWPQPEQGNPRAWCRQCGWSGDVLALLMETEQMTFVEACNRLSLTLEQQPRRRAQQPHGRVMSVDQSRPALASESWQQIINRVVAESMAALRAAEQGRAYLAQRGLLGAAGALGWLAAPVSARWGDAEEDRLWLPSGIVIPWRWKGRYISVNVRRLDGAEPKYVRPRGAANGLYRGDLLHGAQRAVLVEGEFDALSAAVAQRQALGAEPVVAVATGSASGGRLWEAIALLAQMDEVLVAFDTDAAGEAAAGWWLDTLPNSRRLVPQRHDVNDMLRAGDDLLAWLGITPAPAPRPTPTPPAPAPRPASERIPAVVERVLDEPPIRTFTLTPTLVRATPDGALGWTEDDGRTWCVVRDAWRVELAELRAINPDIRRPVWEAARMWGEAAHAD